jgi:hypothetical protein
MKLISYPVVSNAQWKPTYELHATTESGKPSSSVSLHYRARITQSTGEDWNNTALTLSTVASDTVVKRIPQLNPVKIHPRAERPVFQKKGFIPTQNNPFGPAPNVIPFQQQQQQQQQWVQQQQIQQQRPVTLFGSAASAPLHPQQTGFAASQSSGLFGAPAVSAPALAPAEVSVDPALMQEYARELSLANALALPEEDDDFEDLEGPGAITEPTTVVSETPMAISFSVHGESTIPSDGVEHQVSVAVLPFLAKISYISIPRIDPRVFLQVKLHFLNNHSFFDAFVFYPSAKSKTAANTGYSQDPSVSSLTTAMFPRLQSTLVPSQIS